MQNKLTETHWNVYNDQFIAITRDTTTVGLRMAYRARTINHDG